MEINKTSIKLSQVLTDLINQLFEIEKKVDNLKEENSITRNINRIKTLLEEDMLTGADGRKINLTYHNPINEEYKETRTDCEISIIGDDTHNLGIVEVIKPIIHCTFLEEGKLIKIICQKGVVLVKSRNI